MGSSIHDVTIHEGVKDFLTTELIKHVTLGEGGIKNCRKLRDVIYGRHTNNILCHLNFKSFKNPFCSPELLGVMFEGQAFVCKFKSVMDKAAQVSVRFR